MGYSGTSVTLRSTDNLALDIFVGVNSQTMAFPEGSHAIMDG